MLHTSTKHSPFMIYKLPFIFYLSSNGIEKLNVDPSPFFEVNQSLPPFLITKSLHNNNPSPEPSSLFVPKVLKCVSV